MDTRKGNCFEIHCRPQEMWRYRKHLGQLSQLVDYMRRQDKKQWIDSMSVMKTPHIVLFWQIELGVKGSHQIVQDVWDECFVNTQCMVAATLYSYSKSQHYKLESGAAQRMCTWTEQGHTESRRKDFGSIKFSYNNNIIVKRLSLRYHLMSWSHEPHAMRVGLWDYVEACNCVILT